MEFLLIQNPAEFPLSLPFLKHNFHVRLIDWVTRQAEAVRRAPDAATQLGIFFISYSKIISQSNCPFVTGK